MQKLMKALHKNEKGFTLVELMVVVVIIGVLVAIAIPVFNLVTQRAEQGACEANQRMIEGAVLQYSMGEPLDFGTTGTYAGVGINDVGVGDGAGNLASYFQAGPNCPTGGQYYITYTVGSPGSVTHVLCECEHHDHHTGTGPYSP